MAGRDWDEDYKQEVLPWDTDEPDPNLVEAVRRIAPERGRALDVGCGTGTNAIWLASAGFEVVGVDVSERAVERAEARAKAMAPDGRCTFATLDFLAATPPGAPFDFV